MVDVTTVDLTDAKDAVDSAEKTRPSAELQEYSLGEIVSVDGEGDGVIAAEVTSNFTWPTDMDEDEAKEFMKENDYATAVKDDNDIEIEASPESPMYVIALVDGGSVAAAPSDLSGDASIEDEEGKDIQSWEDVQKDSDETELAAVYDRVDDPSSYAELQAAKKKIIHEQQAAELADYVEGDDISLDELEEYSVEELVNIPGVDDPHVGFDSMPNGWTRKSVLQAWASLGGMWRTCYARMIREMGPNFATRWCSALKDETLRTEEWRGDF